jgi:hypothetical protein
MLTYLRKNMQVLLRLTFLLYNVKYFKEDSMGRACSTRGEKRNEYRILMGKPEGKRQLARPRRRWEDIIRMDLGEIGWGGMHWIDLVQDRDK